MQKVNASVLIDYNKQIRIMIDPNTAWELIRKNAIKAMQTNMVWHSVKRGAEYSLVYVFDDRIIILRKDKSTEETLTKNKVEQKISELISSGGRVKVGSLVTPSVAEETAFVLFYPQLESDNSNEFITFNGHYE